MLSSQIILGLYRDGNLQLMLSAPPLPEEEAQPHLAEAHNKFLVFQRRDYLNSSAFVVKCFRHEQHNFVLVGLLSGLSHSKASRIFGRAIDECTRAKGVPSMTLHTQLTFHITDQRFLRSLFLYDFSRARPAPPPQPKDQPPETDLGFDLSDVGVDGSHSAFGFLQKMEPPTKTNKVKNP